jgi:S-adenosylmethionine:tRNA-ribosyltransferase-isomerase (queuine synthetase)
LIHWGKYTGYLPFAGREQVLAAYVHAVQQNHRFFSYDDCVFLD